MFKKEESFTTRQERLAREKDLFLCTSALDDGEIEALAYIWQKATYDAELERQLLDIEAAYEHEKSVAVAIKELEYDQRSIILNDPEATHTSLKMPQLNGLRPNSHRSSSSFAGKLVAILVVSLLLGSFWLLIASRQHSTNMASGGTPVSHTLPIVIVPNGNDGTIHALRIGNGTQLWQYRTGHPITGPTIVVQKDRVYALSDDGHVYAFRLEDGTLLWQHTFKISRPVGEDQVRLLASDNFVAVGFAQTSADLGNSGHGFVAALQATNGALLWQYQVPANYEKNPLVDVVGDTIYITETSSSGNITKALKAENRTLLWQNNQHPLLPPVWDGTGTLVALNGVLYGYSSGGLEALNAQNGELIWQQKASRDGDTPGGMLVAGDERLFLATPNLFCAYRMTNGEQLWCTHAKAPSSTSNIFEEFEGLIYMNGVAYVGRGIFNAPNEFQIEAWDGASGRLLWKWPSQSLLSPDSSWTFSGGQGVLFIPGANSGLYAIRGMDGRQLWFNTKLEVGLNVPGIGQ